MHAVPFHTFIKAHYMICITINKCCNCGSFFVMIITSNFDWCVPYLEMDDLEMDDFVHQIAVHGVLLLAYSLVITVLMHCCQVL